MSAPLPIIFFDGDCRMCNAFVQLILRVDRRGVFYFAPRKGTTAQELLPPLERDPGQWSMIYFDENGMHDQSDASLEVYRRLGFPWSVLSWLRWIPRAIRNPMYRTLARNRYRWFGKRDSCAIPSPGDEARFLP